MRDRAPQSASHFSPLSFRCDGIIIVIIPDAEDTTPRD